jgi:tRNA pseudouridine38-40 synthase
LSENIAIKRIFEVPDDLHARFDATYRTYEYYISLEKNPFSKDSSVAILASKAFEYQPDERSLQNPFEYDDFTSFAKLHTDNKTNICKIYKAEWEQLGNQLKFTISADRFLRNMVAPLWEQW